MCIKTDKGVLAATPALAKLTVPVQPADKTHTEAYIIGDGWNRWSTDQESYENVVQYGYEEQMEDVQEVLGVDLTKDTLMKEGVDGLYISLRNIDLPSPHSTCINILPQRLLIDLLLPTLPFSNKQETRCGYETLCPWQQ